MFGDRLTHKFGEAEQRLRVLHLHLELYALWNAFADELGKGEHRFGIPDFALGQDSFLGVKASCFRMSYQTCDKCFSLQKRLAPLTTVL